MIEAAPCPSPVLTSITSKKWGEISQVWRNLLLTLMPGAMLPRPHRCWERAWSTELKLGKSWGNWGALMLCPGRVLFQSTGVDGEEVTDPLCW